MSFLEDMAPAAEEAAEKQRRRDIRRERTRGRPGALERAATARRHFEEEMVRRRFGAFVFADQGGHISRVLKKPHTNLVRGGQLVQVLRVEAVEGLGTAEGLFTEENPVRQVVYWYEADGTLIARRDSWEERETSRTDFVAMTPAKPDRV